MLLGIIADDLTGASDIAGFVAKEGLDVIQFVGVPDSGANYDCDAAVVSLKSRSVPAKDAVRDSLAAFEWLRDRGCKRFYFKYCSTFDSTPQGNIGPVTDALLDALKLDMTVVCPSLPVNGRTVRDGILYVNGTPLAETGMRHHPLNPMTDSNLVRLMEGQSRGKAGVVSLAAVDSGPQAVEERLAELRREGISYAVLDAETDSQLLVLASVLSDAPLLTGGSGLGWAVARRLASRNSSRMRSAGPAGPVAGKTIVLSGSCSEMTNRQTANYRDVAPEFKVDVAECLDNAGAYAAEAAAWVDEACEALENDGVKCNAPLINATVPPDELRTIQETYGAAEAAAAIETFFRIVAENLLEMGFVNFIVAGGETSGAVAAALGVKAFRIGPQIDPGVSWVEALDRRLGLAMKSGNFGDESFFLKAQAMIHE